MVSTKAKAIFVIVTISLFLNFFLLFQTNFSLEHFLNSIEDIRSPTGSPHLLLLHSSTNKQFTLPLSTQQLIIEHVIKPVWLSQKSYSTILLSDLQHQNDTKPLQNIPLFIIYDPCIGTCYEKETISLIQQLVSQSTPFVYLFHNYSPFANQLRQFFSSVLFIQLPNHLLFDEHSLQLLQHYSSHNELLHYPFLYTMYQLITQQPVLQITSAVVDLFSIDDLKSMAEWLRTYLLEEEEDDKKLIKNHSIQLQMKTKRMNHVQFVTLLQSLLQSPSPIINVEYSTFYTLQTDPHQNQLITLQTSISLEMEVKQFWHQMVDKTIQFLEKKVQETQIQWNHTHLQHCEFYLFTADYLVLREELKPIHTLKSNVMITSFKAIPVTNTTYQFQYAAESKWNAKLINFQNTTFHVLYDSQSQRIALQDGVNPNLFLTLNKTTMSFTVSEKEEYLFYIHPTCCPTMFDHKWPFYEQSPFLLINQYATTMKLKPFEEAVQESLQFWKEQKNNQRFLSKTISTATLYHTWSKAKLPVCQYDCQNPLKCLQNGKCRCILPTSCNPRFEIAKQKEDVLTVFGKLLGQQWPKVQVLKVPDAMLFNINNNTYCTGRAGNKHTGCFVIDYFVYQPLRSISVENLQDADIFLFPFHQMCVNFAGYRFSELVKYSKSATQSIMNPRFATVFTHDYGACGNFYWNPWQAVSAQQWVDQNTIGLAPMGDYFTPCYYPFKDITIPPVSCFYEVLEDKFFTNVLRMKQRENYFFFKGTIWGTGTISRHALSTCRTLLPKVDYQENDYMKKLGNTKLCALVAGTTNWATRFVDVIYAGCIPVFVTEFAHFPFFNLVDYSKFSIQVEVKDLPNIQHILAQYNDEQLQQLQDNLLLVREIFNVKRDPSKVTDWSVQDMLLRSMFSVLHTSFPTNV